MGFEERQALIKEIEKRRNSRVICCITSDRPNAQGIIAKDFIPLFYKHLNSFENAKNVDVFICTMGGDTQASFGLCRLIREFSEQMGVLIPEKCHSGGTLFALGADQIFMTKMATLSPIDPSISGPLNPTTEILGTKQPVPVSVESVAGFKALVRDEWKLSKEFVGEAFKLLTGKIDPLLLGDVYRSRQQIERLAKILLMSHRNDHRQIEKIVTKLAKDLGSHDYLISKTETREILGHHVVQDDADLENLIMQLYKDFALEMELGKPYDAMLFINEARAKGVTPPFRALQKLVIIESTFGSDVWERELRLTPSQMMTPFGPQETVRQEFLKNGWK